MSFTTWLRNLHTSASPKRGDRRRMHSIRRLGVELLEDRLCPSGQASGVALSTPDALTRAQVSAAYSQLPLTFEVNQGQADAGVNFLSRGAGYSLFLTPGTAVIDVEGGPRNDAIMAVELVGANAAAPAAGLDRQVGTTNYLTGNDPSRWHTGVANYGRVKFQNVYPGIDLVYYGNQGQLEYDFVLAPGADPRVIRLSFRGAEGLTIDSQGNLLVHMAAGDLVEHAPVVYQEGGGRETVAGRYVLEGNGQVRFDLGAYDATRPLVIDPVLSLSYSTFLGGNGTDHAYSIAVDGAGNAYVTGDTNSTNFPTKSPMQAGNGGFQDVFVAKLNPAGNALVYTTYLGGQGNDVGTSLAVDGAGNAYVAGFTESTNFPTRNPLYANHGGGTWDAFVAKLNGTGSALIYSTYLGGSGQDRAQGIAVDGAGNAYVTGTTGWINFPTVNPLFPVGNAGFVAELNAAGSALIYSTPLRGAYPNAIALDGSANAYLTGSTSPTSFSATAGAFQTTVGGQGDAFVMKLLPGGTAVAYATFLGGSSGPYAKDIAYGIAVDRSGNAYVTGYTDSTNFPTTPGAFQTVSAGGGDAFVTELNADGTGLVYSTYLGGGGVENYPSDRIGGIALDGAGNAYVTGETRSNNFPVTANALQLTLNVGVLNGGADAFVAKINPALLGTASLVYSSYLGGSAAAGDTGYGIAVDGIGNAYVTGTTTSADFPTKNALQIQYGGGAHACDAFVTKLTAPVVTTGPTLAVGDVALIEGNANTANAVFTVSLADAGTETITVNYGTADGTATAGSDYTAIAGTLTFAPGQLSQTVTVLVSGDRVGEPDETFFVNLSNPTNATIVDGQAMGTIVDDEPRITIGDVTRAEGKKGQTTLYIFTVTLSAAYDQAVTMSFRTADGTARANDSDYIGRTGTLAFAPGEMTKTITIEVKGDSKKEANETFYLNLFDNSSNSLLAKNGGIGTILNDD